MVAYNISGILSQIGGDMWGNILWFVVFMVFMLFYPRLMLMQTLMKLERSALLIEDLSKKGKQIVIYKIAKKPNSRLRASVSDFLEFFAITPVELDPYGIVKKFEHIVNLMEKRFKYFVNQVAPHMDEERKAQISMGLSGAVSLNEVAKIVRHFVETIRKTNNLQLAMVLQMQLPLIEKMAKALFDGTEALANGWLIGDCAGSLVAARMNGKIGKGRGREIEETIVVKKRIGGRSVFIIKAKGPGGRLGKLGKAVESIARRNKIAKIITIDAKAKLEGEKTGGIAEGVGVAIGGVGVDSVYIENMAVGRDIPLDAVAIKMSPEEAIQPIKAEVLAAIPEVVRRVEENIKSTKGRGCIIVVGVGNSNGVGNDEAAAKSAEASAKKIARIVKARQKKEKKSKWEWIWGG